MRTTVAALLATAAGQLGLAGPAAAQHATPFDLQDGERAYSDSCANCHGPDGNLIEGIDFARGVYRRALGDDEIVAIIRNGIPDTPMPPTPGMSEEQARRIVTHLRAWAEEGRVAVDGNPGRGRALFFGAGGCEDCHAVDGRGPRRRAGLSTIGRDLRALLGGSNGL